MVLSLKPSASTPPTTTLVPHQRPRTQEIPKSSDIWHISSNRNANTEPHLPARDSSLKPLTNKDPESQNDFEILSNYPRIANTEVSSRNAFHLDELEDPESDISSASGQSASLVSTPASREIDASQEIAGPLRKWPEWSGQLPYTSQMRMSQFHQEQNRVNWNPFVQIVTDALLEHPCPQNGWFQLIGDGGSSFVYAAAFQGRRSNDTLAVKVLRNGKLYNTAGLPNEFKIMPNLRHNHIVAYVSSFVRGDKLGVLLYPLARCNLAEYLKETSENSLWYKRQDPVQIEALSAALGCLTSAVMYLHVSQKIKHKDIKPENILLDGYGSVLLADFGISKQYPDNTVTCGPTPFTEKYAPPEVVHQDERDLSADIFSLGCVFIEMVTVILGESLENLNNTIFARCGSDRRSYSQSLLGVSDWICHLKSLVYRERFSVNPSATGSWPTDNIDNNVSHQPLAELHLDVILRMVSKTPEERPPITDLYELFKSFASQCPECQDGNHQLEQGQRFDSAAKFVIKAALLAEPRPVSNTHQLFIPNTQSQVISSLDKSQEQHSYQDRPSDTITMKRHPELTLNEDDSDYLSEAESLDSDCSMTDDHEQEVNAVSAELMSEVRILVHNLLKENDLRHSILQPKDASSGGFNSCPVEGSTSTRRQGSPMERAHSKRRLTGKRTLLQLPEGKGRGDDEEDPEDRRGGSSEVKPRGTLRSNRPFACHFYQRDPDRYTNRACRGPSWYGYSRVKEHLGRVHRIYRCNRCQEAFIVEDELHQHQREVNACEVRERIFDDDYDWGQGFDDIQNKELKSRLRSVDDEEKWRRCYRILFPNDSVVPSPYCNDEKAEMMSDLKANVSHHLYNHLSETSRAHEWPLVARAIQAGFDDYLAQQRANQPSTPATQDNLVEVNAILPEVNASTVQTGPNYGYLISSEQSRTEVQRVDRTNDTNDSAYYTNYNHANDSLQGVMDPNFLDGLFNLHSDDCMPSSSQAYPDSSGRGSEFFSHDKDRYT